MKDSINFNNLANTVLVKKVLEQASKSESRILEADFIDLYGESNVDKDLAEVERLDKEFSKTDTVESRESKKMADAFEFIVNEQIELADWLGESTNTYKTALYDDYKNGIDTVTEIVTDDRYSSYFGLAFDVSYANDVTKKFQRIKWEIDKGVLPKIKYFQSENTDFRGELSEIPRVVIGADRNTIDELMELVLKKDALSNRELASHFFQFQLIEEIMYQLEVFKAYAESVNQPQIAKKYDILAGIIRDIQKGKKVRDPRDRDTFLGNMKDSCDHIFKK